MTSTIDKKLDFFYKIASKFTFFSKIVDRTSMLKENILVDLTQLFKVHFFCPCVVSQGENVLDFLWKSCGLSGLGDSAVPNLRHNKQIIKD